MRKILATALAVTIALGLNSTVSAGLNEQELYDSYCVMVGEEYGVCPELLQAMCFKESSYRADVKSADGNCIGLMQVNPVVHKDRMARLGVTDLTDAYSNILVGTDYLLELFEEYEDVYEVLMIYNAGQKGKKLYEQGKYSNYAVSICEMAEELELEHGK